MMTPFKFKFRFAIRNITHNKGSSLSLLLSLGLVSMFVIMIANLFFVFQQLFYYDSLEDYYQIDVVMTYDENATSRLINKRNLGLSYGDDIVQSLSFFNLYVVSETTEEIFYTQLMSALPYEMEQLIDYDLDSLNDNEIVITSSLASSYHLDVGDSLMLYMLDEAYEYQINQIVPDTGLFTGNNVFVDKTRLLQDFYGLPSLNNLGNTLYLELDPSTDIDQFIEDVKADDEYANYYIYKTIDYDLINQDATRTSSILFGTGVLIVITLGMVLHSLFPLFTMKLKKQTGTILTLGGNFKFIMQVWGIQLLVFFLITSVFGLISSYVIFNIAARAYDIISYISLNWWPTIIGLCFLAGFVILEGLISFGKLKKESAIALSSDRRYEKQPLSIYWLIGSFVLFFFFLITQPFSLEVNSLIIIVFSIFASFQGISFITMLIGNYFSKRKHKNLFRVFNLRYIADNKHVHHSLKVLFASFLVILITLSVRSFVTSEINSIRDSFNFDYALTNIFNYDSSLKSEIMTNYEPEAVDEVVFFRDVKLEIDDNGTPYDDKMQFFVSMDYSRFPDYFGFELISQLDEKYLDNTIPYVLIADSYRYTYSINVGDQVGLITNSSHDVITLEVAGFIKTSYDNFVYSNLIMMPEFQDDFTINSLLILTAGQQDIFRDLLEDYGSEMYYVLEVDKLVDDVGNVFETAGDLFLVLTTVMIASFLIVIINNTILVFYTMKKDYARLKTLGVKNKDFLNNIFKEIGLSTVAVMLFVIAEIFVLTEFMPRIMLFFDFYKQIVPNFGTIVFAIMLVSISFLLSYSLYFAKIIKLGIIEEINLE